jgi:excisionase family DNA binding protein
MLEALIGVTELARLLGVPQTTIYAWNHKSSGPRPIRVGKYVRYAPSEVQRWIDAQAEPGRVGAA